MGYTHKDSSKPRHRWAKMTNLQNQIDLSDVAYNSQCPDRSLSTWEKAELRELCDEKGLPEPQDMTLEAFVAIAGRWPQYFENGQWITPPLIQAGPGTMTAAPDGAHRHPEHESKLLTTSIGEPSTQESHEPA